MKNVPKEFVPAI